MVSFQLVQTTTPDQLIHQGMWAAPTGKVVRGLLWVHGLTGTFYSSVDMINALAENCVAHQLAFASFNTRGHDGITSIKKVDPTKPKGYGYTNGGAGYEVFEECVYDIQSGIDFLHSHGIEEIILVGHSTGANKVSYAVSQIRDVRIKGVVLMSGVADKLAPDIDKKQLHQDIAMMQQLSASDKGDGLVVGKTFFPITPKRFLSLFTPGPEDQFDYAEKSPNMSFFSSITVPVSVVLGSNDEYLDRDANDVLSVFRQTTKSKVYNDMLIEGGTHSFQGKEQEVALKIVEWSKSL